MADKKFQIPASFKPEKKIITTPRVGITIATSIGFNKAKTAVIKSNIAPKLDFFPDDSVTSTMLGTPVFDQLVIKKAIDTVVKSDQTGPDYAKFDAVVITVNQTRNIVTTPIQGRNGTVKEYISDGDYDINVTGIITSSYAQRSPKEDIENISELMKLPNEIIIISDFLSLFKIQYAVIHSYKFNQVEGSVNQIQMDMRLISDEPVELKLGIDPNA